MAKGNKGRQAVVGRYFRGLPVIDATESLRVVINRADIAKARKLDPNNCVFAQACRRLYDSHAVLVLRRTAYVELPDDNGRRTVNRFVLSDETNGKIVRFDKTGEAPEGGFLFNAPSKSNTMDAKAKYGKAYDRAVRNGSHKVKATGKPNKKALRAMIGVRDGRGKLGINYAF